MTELLKKQIEVQLTEYEQAIEAAIKWHREWKAREPNGFRRAGRKQEADAT